MVLGRAARARHEVETITEQLTAAYGLGGRPRTAGDPAERVRKAVTNQIRRALERICAAHLELGRHLSNALRTGFVPAYRPEPPNCCSAPGTSRRSASFKRITSS